MTQSTHQFIFREEEQRVDKFLSDQFPDISRSKIKSLIENGMVSLDGEIVLKAGTKIRSGSSVDINIPDDRSDSLVPEPISLEILHDDEDVIVVNKPAGLVVHPGAGNPSGTLVNALLAYFPPIRYVGEEERPGVVHRLDKETSGVVIFAKTNKAYKWLVRQFKSRDTAKSYLALVDGHPPTPTGRIEAPITRDLKNRTRMAVGLRGQGKPAVSEYFELQRFKEHTYLEVHPITGRTHQVRVHMSYLGVPIVGDTIYGRRRPSIDMERFFLHAKSLSVKLPGDRVVREFEAPLPQELKAILTMLNEKERK